MEKYDLLIPVGPKDYIKCKHAIDCAIKFLDPKPDNIFVVSPTSYDINHEYSIINVLDSDILYDFDPKYIKYRPNWIKQQLIKLLQNITEKDKYLVIDSDFFLTSTLSINPSLNHFYLTIDQYHLPYFIFQKQFLGIDKQYNYSFISEIMMFDKNIINHMLQKKQMSKLDFINFCYETVNNGCYLSEQELYGNYVYYNYRDSTSFEKLQTHRYGKECDRDEIIWSNEEIINYINYGINNNLHAIGLHSWSRT